jgi:hypothetical protein
VDPSAPLQPEGFILVCDQAPIDTSETTLRYPFEQPEIMMEPWPKYAPELNPEEHCHENVKVQVANITPQGRTDMRQSLDRGLARLPRRPDLVLSFVHAAGLSVRQLW